jgi:hypothetical protein
MTNDKHIIMPSRELARAMLDAIPVPVMRCITCDARGLKR